jgi:hypothetical protein
VEGVTREGGRAREGGRERDEKNIYGIWVPIYICDGFDDSLDDRVTDDRIHPGTQVYSG